MKIDVQGLEITPDEFQKITDKTREYIDKPSFFCRRNQAIYNLRDYLLYICWMHKVKEGKIFLEWLSLIKTYMLIMVWIFTLHFLYFLTFLMLDSYSKAVISLSEIIFKPLAITAFIILAFLFRFVAILYSKSEYKTYHLLRSLMGDIENYIKIIKEIKVCEIFIESARSQELMINERKIIVEAIKLTKEDLITALKIDRFIRENKDFRSTHPDLLRKSNQNNLNALQSLKIEEETSTYQRWLNELLQIAVRVQEKMSSLRECDN